MSADINLVEQAGAWGDVSLDAANIIEAVFSIVKEDDDGKSIAVVLSDDEHIQHMNHDFRGMNKPTNVLSFPSDEADEWGDVILSLDTIKKEAIEQEKSLYNHAAHMLVHGVLHLVGYDHIDDVEAEIMETLEVAILDKVGIENPYENE